MIAAIRQAKRRIILIAILSALLFTAMAAIKLTYNHFRIISEMDRVQKQIADLQRQKSDLEKTRSSFGNIAQVEQIARETLNLQKPGEHVVILLPAQAQTETPSNASLENKLGNKDNSSNLMKWWAYFFGR